MTAHDPFRPGPKHALREPDPPPAPGVDYEGMRRSDLVALARRRGLDDTGNRVALVTRLRVADSADAGE
ncbi:MAG: SAP domain-containing protein [Gammaproteobacteria bacterium]